MKRRDHLIFSLVALVGAFIITRVSVVAPTFTDAFYHYNAAQQLVNGQGLTDHYVWFYVGAVDYLPAPSHLYWMPLTSLSAALGMWLFGMPDSYGAAQLPFTLMYATTVYVGFWLGQRLGKTRFHAWLAGLLTLFSGFFVPFWGTIDTFAPYALVGALCLLMIGLALEMGQRRVWYWLLAGLCAGLGHLTRADGLVLLFAGWAAILWPFYSQAGRRQAERGVLWRLFYLGMMTLGYGLVMLPWFMRNLNLIGTPLPLGGAQGIWFTRYDDIFNYPAGATAATFFANGPGILFQSRWEALTGGLMTLIAVEGLIVVAPLMLIALWRRRHKPFLRGFWLYTLGMHMAMTLIFPYPGLRGGVFHSAAALVPWWMALGAVGLDDIIGWIAARRRHWQPQRARQIFSVALVALAICLSAMTTLPRLTQRDSTSALYPALRDQLPLDARVLINDPPRLFYFTGLGGAVLPNAAPPILLDLARQYDIDYLVLESSTTESDDIVWQVPAPLRSIPDAPPDFLTEVEINVPGVRLYAINH